VSEDIVAALYRQEILSPFSGHVSSYSSYSSSLSPAIVTEGDYLHVRIPRDRDFLYIACPELWFRRNCSDPSDREELEELYGKLETYTLIYERVSREDRRPRKLQNFKELLAAARVMLSDHAKGVEPSYLPTPASALKKVVDATVEAIKSSACFSSLLPAVDALRYLNTQVYRETTRAIEEWIVTLVETGRVDPLLPAHTIQTTRGSTTAVTVRLPAPRNIYSVLTLPDTVPFTKATVAAMTVIDPNSSRAEVELAESILMKTTYYRKLAVLLPDRLPNLLEAVLGSIAP